MTALPLGVATGTVAGRLTRAAAPGTIGEPIPDARVTLTPEFGIAAAPHATPPALILPDPVHCTTDDTGLLLDERGNPGVELVATDAPGLEPAAWTWRVIVYSPHHRQAKLVHPRPRRADHGPLHGGARPVRYWPGDPRMAGRPGGRPRGQRRRAGSRR